MLASNYGYKGGGGGDYELIYLFLNRNICCGPSN